MAGRHYPQGIPPKPKAPSVHDWAHQAADGDLNAAYQVALMARPQTVVDMIRIVSPGLCPTRAGADAAMDAFALFMEKGRPAA